MLTNVKSFVKHYVEQQAKKTHWNVIWRLASNIESLFLEEAFTMWLGLIFWLPPLLFLIPIVTGCYVLWGNFFPYLKNYAGFSSDLFSVKPRLWELKDASLPL